MNLALLAVSLVLAVAAVEIVVRSFGLFAEARRVTVESAAKSESDSAAIRTVPHPYLGWTERPATSVVAGSERSHRSDGKSSATLAPVNLLGFRSHVADYRDMLEDDYVVGCFGGSMARNLCLKDDDLIVEELERRRPELKGSVRVLNFAADSYKQPQQLFALTMALALEVPLDAVVSLDGFNEVAIGGSGVRHAYHPLFPARSAYLSTLAFATGNLSEEEVLASAEILRLRRRAWRRRDLVSRLPLLGTLETTRALVGLLALRDLEAAKRKETAFQERTEAPAADYLATLPDECLEGSDLRTVAPICWDLIGDLWVRSTLSMDAVARRFDIPFLHLLQPNQYVPDSKTLSEEERGVAIAEESGWGRYARAGYPVLRSRLRGLKAHGVRSVDLTGIFSDHPETLYRDDCCHVNREGNRILAVEVAEQLSSLVEAD